MTLEQIRELPAETLAYLLLPELPHQFRRTQFILRTVSNLTRPAGPGVHRTDLRSHTLEGILIATALQQLVNDGVLVPWPAVDPEYDSSGQGDMLSLTPWGGKVRSSENGQAMVTARRRIGVDLHPDLEMKLRDLIAVGAFESAALNALRAIEARVRRLARDPRDPKTGARLTSTTLMQTAFSEKNGMLTDPSAEKGERVGVMNLFAGAFGAIRNVLAHTDEVKWSDSVEAAEYVLLADLLMRLLDQVESRME